MGDMAPTPEEKQAKKDARDARYERNLKYLQAVTGYVITEITPYQFRIFGEGVGDFIDIYPTNQRYHNLLTQDRGRYKTVQGFVDVQYKKALELKTE